MAKNESKNNKEDLLVLEDLHDDLYDSSYAFDSSDMMSVLPIPREYTITPRCEDLTKKWIKRFTLDIPNFVHFTGSLFFGTQGTGKTILSEQTAIIMNEYYGDALIILQSNDLQVVIDYLKQMSYKEKNEKVFFIIIDDALTKQSKSTSAATKKIVQGLSIIRRCVDGEGDLTKDETLKMRSILYVELNTQLLYFLDKDIRSLLKYRAYKSLSGTPYDKDKIAKWLGDDLYELLGRIDRSAEIASNRLKHITVVDMNSEVGYITLDEYDEEKLAEIRKKIIRLTPADYLLPAGYIKMGRTIAQSHISSSFWARFYSIFIEELHSKKERRRKDYLSVAKQVIGVSTLERNIELFCRMTFDGWHERDLAKEYKSLKCASSVGTMIRKVRNFLLDELAFTGIISEQFFLEKLKNSTILPELSFSRKDKSFFRKELSATQHPDIYVASKGKLVAVIAVKMHFERALFDPRIELLYDVPCYALIIDVGRTAQLRFGRITKQDDDTTEMKVNMVELRSDWAEVEAILKKDLIDDRKKDG